MDAATLSLAAGAGMLAALNPCGFALLPAYLGLLVLPEREGERPNRIVAVRRALVLTAAMTSGFALVFAGFGLVVSPLASSAQRYLPWVSLFVGAAVVVAGGWLLAGRDLPTLRQRRGTGVTRRFSSMFAFGVSYALASLTCTIGPFLAIVVASFRSGSWTSGVALFVSYALGMGAVVGTAAVAVAVANVSVVRGLRRSGQWVPRLAGGLLVLVGAYVAYYGWWEIRLLRGDGADDPVVATALDLQSSLANLVGMLEPWQWLAILVALVLVAAGGRVSRGRRGRSSARTGLRRRGAVR